MCVASSTCGQTGDREMRDFDLRRAARTEGGVDEQARISTIHGGAEDRDFTRGGSAWRYGERGVPAARIVALGAVPVACGGPGRFGRGAQAGCAAHTSQR